MGKKKTIFNTSYDEKLIKTTKKKRKRKISKLKY